MQNNPEIEQVVEAAVKLAREKCHEYVVTEHLLLGMLRHLPFRRVVDKFGADADLLWTKLRMTLSPHQKKLPPQSHERSEPPRRT